MRKTKMLAVLLAGLITLSLAGCTADKASDNTESGAVSTESSMTVTDKISEPTVESSLPADTESTTGSTTKKEKESSTAPANSGSKADTAKPADTKPTAPPRQTEPPKITEPPKQTEPPKVTEPPTETTAPQPTEPSFDIDKWIDFAKRYAESIGLVLDPEAVDCWDNPMIAGPKSKYLERDIKGILDRYKTVEGFSAVWIWAESEGNGNYRLFIGYA